MVDNGLVYLKEVAKYFMDFLETDFHKRKNPRRTIKLRNDENLMLGIKLEKYPKLNDVIRKSIRDSFNSKSLKQIAKGNYTSPIYYITFVISSEMYLSSYCMKKTRD